MNTLIIKIMGLNDGLPTRENIVVDPNEHTHANGVTHSHAGGQTPHTHDNTILCICTEKRDRHCSQHG